MALDFVPTAGSKLYVLASAPASFDDTGWSALTFTAEVGGTNDIGEVGTSKDAKKFDTYAGEITYRGTTKMADIEETIPDDPTDAGQIILKAAYDAARGSASELVSAKIVAEDGRGVWFQAKVSKFAPVFGGTEDLLMRSYVMSPDPETVLEFTA